ncbi:hypothetical protein CONCODRAFT_73162 [Conidiobolus coronatus NRRL 28638]|uniref:Uncharacterized protein n=1 Tax=Conidiobolus coronatus (strain ATCC 28846 / CBS 209.66 / NRRL 28638) TaxID=796925 RepID=A0A137NX47_CONC2|nr:hypothetical protein CONCODRAFT_73162 [Conidiobolus coronatus NRRL 28638]|eukprot:KXN67209.1 hypothetical protein CONCODRAFT_73162 [Conidiobolus coronatus NRRL 28638]
MNGIHDNKIDNLEFIQLSYQKLVNQLINRQFDKVWSGNIELLTHFSLELVERIVNEGASEDISKFRELWSKSWCLQITTLSKIYEEEGIKLSSEHFNTNSFNYSNKLDIENFPKQLKSLNKNLANIISILNNLYFDKIYLIPDDIILTCIVVSIQQGQFNFAESFAKYFLSSFHDFVNQQKPQNLEQQEPKEVELDANLKSSYEAISSSLVLFVLCPLEKYSEAEAIVNNDPILTQASKQIIGKNLIEQTKQIQLKKKQELDQRKLAHNNLNSSSNNTNGSATKPSIQKANHQVYQGKELPPNFKSSSSSSTGGGRNHSNSYFVQLRQFSDSIYHRVQLLSPLYRTTISVFLFTIVFIWWSRRRLISPWFQKYTNSQAKDSNSFLMRIWKSFRPALPPTSGPQSVI